MPLSSVELIEDIPAETAGKPVYSFIVREALYDALLEDGRLDASGKYPGTIAYSFDKNNFYTAGWNDVITLSSTSEVNGNKRYAYVYFLLGGDQLNAEEVYYRIAVKFSFFEDDDSDKYREVWIDRTSGTSPEFEDKPRYSFYVKDALNKLLTEENIISGSEEFTGVIRYSAVNSSDVSGYEMVNWNDIVSPRYTYSDHDEEFGEITYSDVYFIIGGYGSGISAVRYKVRVKFKYIDEDFLTALELKLYNEKGSPLGGDHFDDFDGPAYSVSGDEYYSYYTSISSNSVGKNSSPRFLVGLPNGYSEKNVSVYEGMIYNEEGISSSKDITSKIIWNEKNVDPYEMDSYNYPDGYSVLRSCYKEFTFVIEMQNGSRTFLPVRYNVSILTNWVDIQTVEINYDGIFDLYSSPDEDDTVPFGAGLFYDADGFDSVDESVYIRYFDYIDKDLYDKGHYCTDVNKIAFACIGNYDSQQAAEKDGAKDIKSELFSEDTGAAVDFSNCRNITAYLHEDTVEEVHVKALKITVVDIYGAVHHSVEYFAIIQSGDDSSLKEPDIEVPSYETGLEISGALKKFRDEEGNDAEEKFSVYKIKSKDDSYYKNGYQTVFIMDGDGKHITDGSVIYPTFTASAGTKVYAEDAWGINSLQFSGQTPMNFHSGRAVQYAVTSESRDRTQNYWITYVTRQNEGGKLFVNAANNEDHYYTDKSSGKKYPQREIFLNAKSVNHDILFANIGNRNLTGLYVNLSDDTQGVRLDPYWTITENGVRTLAPFPDSFEAGSNPDNIGKLRLILVDDDYFGGISGTLTIGADGIFPVEIKLTGVAGIPKITTGELYPGVKFVPYSCIIMTNNMYDSDAMQFRKFSGELPDGIEILPNGELYGIPTETGEFTFTVEASYKGYENYTARQTYTLVIMENTDENVDAVNEDSQGHSLLQRVSRNVNVYYNGMNGDIPNVTSIQINSRLFRSEGEFGDLAAFYIDGIELTEGTDYYAEEGSTIITVLAQTFSHIGMTDRTVPHTLAAEFRIGGTSDGELKRSAQNVYLNYIISKGRDETPVPQNPGTPNPPSSGDGETSGDSGTDSSGTGGSDSDGTDGSDSSGNSDGSGSGSDSSQSGQPGSSGNSVAAVMSIVDTGGNPVSGLALELHSEPQYAATDGSGVAKFGSVEFGRHTLYVYDRSSGKQTSGTFTLISGANTGMNGNVITAVPGETIHLTIEYDGSGLAFLSVETDVSSGAGINGRGDIAWIGGLRLRIPVFALIIICIPSVITAATVIIRKKRNS